MLRDFSAIYEGRILKALAGTDGCLGAALLVHQREPEEVVSLTVWRDLSAAAAYDGDGRFARLLNQAEHLLEESAAAPVDAFPERDLAIEGYDAELIAPPHLRAVLAPGGFARTVSAHVAPDRSEEFDTRYRAEVATALVDFPGLRAVMLLHRVGAGAVTVGLSFWEGEESAARYELSGRFEELASGLNDTLSPLYRWRRSMSPDSLEGSSTGSFAVDGYLVTVAGTF
jgi:heme-degrading monooxygenase HmoA